MECKPTTEDANSKKIISTRLQAYPETLPSGAVTNSRSIVDMPGAIFTYLVVRAVCTRATRRDDTERCALGARDTPTNELTKAITQSNTRK